MLMTNSNSISSENNSIPLASDVLDYINKGTANFISLFNPNDGDMSPSSSLSWDHNISIPVKINCDFCWTLTHILLNDKVLDIELDDEYYNDIFLLYLPYYNKIYELEAENRNEDVSGYTTILMHTWMRSKDIDSIDFFIKNLDKKLVSRWSLIALLRTTCVYKHEIESWKDLFLYTRKYLNDNGHNAKRLLMGLDRGLGLED